MSDLDTVQRLALALAIGFLIGLERGWKARDQGSGARQAGIRTFTLYGFLGGLSGLLGFVAGDAVVVVLGLSIGALIVGGYIAALKQASDAGTTTEVAAFATFVLGALAVRGDMLLAAASAVVIVVVLDQKKALHHFLHLIDGVEMTAFIKLLVISVVLLPVLPNEGYGPGGVLNPYVLWWAVVLVSATSFLGYMAIRFAGAHRGPLLMGVFGGLASSTALTFSAARMAAGAPAAVSGVFAESIAAANAMMYLRAGVIVYLFSPQLGLELAGPLAAGAVVAALFAASGIVQAFSGGGEEKKDGAAAQAQDAALSLGSPSDLGLALKFAVALAGFGLLAAIVRERFGEIGMVPLAAVAGLVDVDATSITVSRLVAEDGQALLWPAIAVLTAVAANMVFKLGAAFTIGGQALGFKVALMTAASLIAVGIVAAALMLA
ncbi:MAG: DUF4010 domain-containing protein [Alphaproteobacteria bacterium]|nr:DUF4010 domain-containing protein [Alphaproteobacteria bacterium]